MIFRHSLFLKVHLFPIAFFLYYSKRVLVFIFHCGKHITFSLVFPYPQPRLLCLLLFLFSNTSQAFCAFHRVCLATMKANVYTKFFAALFLHFRGKNGDTSGLGGFIAFQKQKKGREKTDFFLLFLRSIIFLFLCCVYICGEIVLPNDDS